MAAVHSFVHVEKKGQGLRPLTATLTFRAYGLQGQNGPHKTGEHSPASAGIPYSSRWETNWLCSGRALLDVTRYRKVLWRQSRFVPRVAARFSLPTVRISGVGRHNLTSATIAWWW